MFADCDWSDFRDMEDFVEDSVDISRAVHAAAVSHVVEQLSDVHGASVGLRSR